MASSLILTSFMHKLDLMFATYSILYGCSSSLIHMSTFDALPRYFEKRLALAIGLISSGVGAGPLAFTPLLNYLMHLFDWRSALRIIGAGIGIASFVAGLCFTPKERNEKHPILEEKNHELVERPYKILFRNPSTYILVVTICIVCLSYVTSFIHQVQFAIDFGVPEEKAKTLPVFLAIGAIFGRIISGQLMDLNLIDGILLYQSLMLLGGITALVGSLARTYEQLVCYIIIFQLFDGGQQGLTYKATSMALGGEYANEAFSLILFFASISMMLGPVTVGLIVDQTNNYNSMFYFSGIPLITASLILFTLRFVKPRKITKETTGKDNLKNDLCVKYDSPEEDHLIQKISVV